MYRKAGRVLISYMRMGDETDKVIQVGMDAQAASFCGPSFFVFLFLY